MVKPIRLIDLGAIDGLMTQAIYHAVAESMDDSTPDTIILNSTKSPYVCFGYHQDAGSVIDLEKCGTLNIPTVRRKLGGGATYLDNNQLFYQLIFQKSGLPANFRNVYAKMLEAPVRTLRSFGLNAILKDVNEIEVDGKRIAGTGGGQIGDACVVVGNFLFDFDFEIMASLWTAPWDSFRTLAERALRNHITTLSNYDASFSKEELTARLIKDFSESFNRPIQRRDLSLKEKELSEELSEKLSSKEFVMKTIISDSSPRPLKISSGVFIHSEYYSEGKEKFRGCFTVVNDHIEESKIEIQNNDSWEIIEVDLNNVELSNWTKQINLESRAA